MKVKKNDIIFKISIVILLVTFFVVAGAIKRGWVDVPGMLTLLVLVAPLTYVWIIWEDLNER